ncbi:MAG: hypothetical protein DKINENOH_04194 [bacterium]|nr:hypothetical protein [bacterium]
MHRHNLILSTFCLALFVTASASLSQSPKLHEMKVGQIKLVPKIIPPNPDSTLIVVRSTIKDLKLESTMGERVQKMGEGVWYLHLTPGPQRISFNSPGYKQEFQEYSNLAKNRAYEVQISPKGKFPWLLAGLGAVAVCGVIVVLIDGGGGGGTTQPPIEKLPDPPGGPTGNY